VGGVPPRSNGPEKTGLASQANSGRTGPSVFHVPASLRGEKTRAGTEERGTKGRPGIEGIRSKLKKNLQAAGRTTQQIKNKVIKDKRKKKQLKKMKLSFSNLYRPGLINNQN
jgi:hypothetical protein